MLFGKDVLVCPGFDGRCHHIADAQSEIEENRIKVWLFVLRIIEKFVCVDDEKQKKSTR